MSEPKPKLQRDIEEMIISYWYRVLTQSTLSFEDISKTVMEFAKEYEEFDTSTSDKEAKIQEEGQSCCKPAGIIGGCPIFGKFTANPDRIYHWKLKFVDGFDVSLNIGIIEADAVIKKIYERDWWNTPHGFSYFARDGCLYSYVRHGQTYGQEYTKGDIIDVCLDLKNKYELSFAKNDTEFGKAFDVKKSTDYKLGIGMYGKSKTVEILSFEIKY